MAKMISISLDFFESKEWGEKRNFSKAEALLFVYSTLEIEGKLNVALRYLSDKLGWGMSRTEKLVIWLKERYPSSNDGKYILKQVNDQNASPGEFVPTMHEIKMTLFGADVPNQEKIKTEPSFEDKCRYFIEKFNKIRKISNKESVFKVTSKVKTQLRARIGEGYTSVQIFEVLEKAIKDKYHIDQTPTLKYVTPNYILRAEVIERYLNEYQKNELKGPMTNSQKRRAGLIPKVK